MADATAGDLAQADQVVAEFKAVFEGYVEIAKIALARSKDSTDAVARLHVSNHKTLCEVYGMDLPQPLTMMLTIAAIMAAQQNTAPCET